MIAAFWPALPIVMLGWFVGTGAILWLDRRPRSTHGGSLLALTFLAGFATFAVLWSTAVTDGAGAIVAFLAALTLWGWHETAFLMGFVTGPNRGHAAPDLRGFARFRAAAATLIHHELALAATLVALYAVSWNAANMLAAHSFALLFALRLSSKLNIHLGVANLSAEMLPDHLAYLGSYFRRRAMNPLFPLSIMGCAALVWHFATAALALPPGSGGQTAAAILATLSALGLIEHLFLMLPIKDSALWRWAMPRSARSKT
ncbi:putative photosynthetic complex assembly protein PuhE [Sandaracinobacteroides saxicola]|uniref:DUF3623 domain-containing protein n=1 Tax=Sandaracinobacteroides saxicola TaxID=2759707 RepID=A0A7G5IKT5_9SPHN|nr:putative photosynthetic complex assembly protein PuhE [Sandaracinobacteroides saxicola]QMW23977.1 DUF3623 domain-containing protein [Sandaracinobacteroides saxicola]